MWMLFLWGGVCAQEHQDEMIVDAAADSVVTVDLPVGEDVYMTADDVKPVTIVTDTLIKRITITEDSIAKVLGKKVQERFIPDPKKAMWYAIIFPGGGQIYNRKYWKLPLVYGGFLGCIYALNWNNTMYRDYSQAYIDIMDSDENTKSYENFIPAKYNVQANKTRLQELFRRKKNYYRRYRDLSMFCMIGVYALSIIDAYVDAELSSFDISKDLSMKVRPAVIHDRLPAARSAGMNSGSYGLQCSLNF
jgi:hypothetical protein